ncbi:GGDEF domain-containing protein [Glaciecola sp. MH2013]|uniref:GGDEF domain-containing protein n=1 Tax=Glaciecola sp. MH2013 TaxID=2785524 RepID=UPI0018A047C2|nr:GGDEF domain-containing protein [Glaciecola sp. MH2013]MBF7074472.1 GGDEF domain-containing protein [Glaciecola sp. MH2013]
MNVERQTVRSQLREHKRLTLYSIIGTVVHFLLLLYFIFDEQEPLIYYNIVALSCWLYCFYFLRKKDYYRIAILTSLVMLIQLNLVTILYGTESGVLMGLWPLACIFVINTRTRMVAGTVFASVCLISFILLSLYAPVSTEDGFIPGSLEIFILVTGAIMVSAVMSIKSAFRARRNKMIYIANHDTLTGLKNRRFFTTFIAHRQDVIRREGTRFCLALGDIDHFKQINDQHGHQMGDAVLVAIAACFREISAQSDVICRWGGEEFLIFIPESDISMAYPVLEAIREVISDQNIDGINTTISFGVVESDGSEALDELFKAADLLLYKAKQSGRNRVEYE